MQQKVPTHCFGAVDGVDRGGKAPPTSGTTSAQWIGGGGKLVVGLAKEDVHCTLLDVKMQLSAMQEKVDALLRCVEEDYKMGLGSDVSGLGN